jgi:hypothetical protein
MLTCILDIHVSVHHETIYENDQLCRIIDYSLVTLHVSNNIFAHHQEHLNFITASGITHYVAASWYHGSFGNEGIINYPTQLHLVGHFRVSYL